MAVIRLYKQYQIRTGALSIAVQYFIPEGNSYYRLTMDAINDVELSYGFEDQEDLLTFYPNTLKLVFDDFDKQNYSTLKTSLSYSDSVLPSFKPNYGSVDLTLNGVLLFSGFIDPLTLEYKSADKTVSFEAVCYSSQLKDINVDRNNYVDTNGVVIGENYNVSMLLVLYGIYRLIWPDFEWNLYDADYINYFDKGVFCKHNWKLRGRAVYPPEECFADWSVIYGSGNQQGIYGTFMNYDSTNFFSADRPGRTYADMLRIFALQFGAIIGVESPKKVYFIKRFGLEKSLASDISDNLISYSRSIHLPPLRGVRVNNHWNGVRSFEYGEVEKTSTGEFTYPDKISEFNTYIGSYFSPPEQGTCIGIYNQVRFFPVWGECWDPLLSNQGGACGMHELVGKWTLENRRSAKERFEVDAHGIDFSLAKIYSFLCGSNNTEKVYFRPMKIIKNLIKNSTKITGLEL